MNTAGRKAKGRKLQQTTRDLIRETFINELEPDDVQSIGMGQQGMDIQLSPAAQKLFPFAIECKNQEKVNVMNAIEQAISNTKKGMIPAVVFKKNGIKPWITIPFDVFMEIIGKVK
ncbi:MAG: hypothetical protein M0R17_11450 [Candidatus Omnitrophica bacterium]|jgi:hypothetical protein|nr:hypothetical protein [Candidatus Omnitrophota bacterium]